MCGIAGFLHSRAGQVADRATLGRMCDGIRHRGPDAEGLLTEGPLALGHRRLAIIDLSPMGAQPMTDFSGRYTIVYNGEIYNFPELRRELEGLGRKFRSQSDTEVVLEAYRAWGAGGFARLNGIFAFALWDREARSLILARDPVGIKPLFYSVGDQAFTFGSEIKAVLASGFVARDIDDRAIASYFSQNYVAHPNTGWKYVRQLEPGHYLEVRDGRIENRSFSAFSETPETSERDWLEEFGSRWTAALRRQCIADVPVGAFLSGGLDSTAVVRGLKQSGRDDVKLFSVRFGESAYDESVTARSTARAFGMGLEVIDASGDLRDLPEKIAPHLEEPTADASALGVYLICREASRHVKVVLSGDGGDELLAGYDTYRATLLANRMRLSRFRPLLALGDRFTQLLPARDARYGLRQVASRFLQGAGLPFPLNHASWRTIQYPAIRRALFGAAIEHYADCNSALEDYAASARELGECDALSQMLHMDFRYYLPNDMLTKVDRMSMAHGLEVRVPFLDIDFVRFCRRMPSSWKLRGGKSKKFILKEYLRGAVPDATLALPKAGFNFPIETWMRGAWGDLLLDLLGDFRVEFAPYLKRQEVEKLLKRHRARTADFRYELFNILMFGLWLRNRRVAWR